MQRSRRLGGVNRWAWAGAFVASVSWPGRVLAQPSPAAPTTQEVPPPVPAVEPGPSQPSSTQPAPTSPPASSAEPAPAPTAPPRAAPSPPAPPAASAAPPSAPAATPPVATTPPAPPATPAPSPEPEPVEGVRQHDGFFLRVSSGFGAWWERLASEDSNVYGGTIEGRSTGITTSGDLSVGGTLGRGKVLAFSLATTELLASTFRLTDSSAGLPPGELDPGLRQLLVVGPTFLWYPDDRGGFMAEAGLGLALLVPSDAAGSNRRDGEVYAAGGLALSLSGGQQFFISDQFSIGVRGRFTLAAAGGEDDEGVRWLHLVRASPAVLCDVVYH